MSFPTTIREGEPRTTIAPSYGMRPVGGFGIRGWRVHCDCGFLSLIVYGDRREAHRLQQSHAPECREAYRRANR